jgi:hypothetical protein
MMIENLPSPNRAIVWYRFLLWLMPACVALTSAVVGTLLASTLGSWTEPFQLTWWAINLASTLGLGTFETLLRPPESRDMFESLVTFVILQFLIVPVIFGLIVVLLFLMPGF